MATSPQSYDPGDPSFFRRKSLLAETGEEGQHSGMSVSSFFPINNYYDAAKRVLAAFEEACDKECWDDAFVFGTRYCNFVNHNIPNHSYYRMPEYAPQKMETTKNALIVMDCLEKIKVTMNEEEREKHKKRLELERTEFVRTGGERVKGYPTRRETSPTPKALLKVDSTPPTARSPKPATKLSAKEGQKPPAIPTTLHILCSDKVRLSCSRKRLAIVSSALRFPPMTKTIRLPFPSVALREAMKFANEEYMTEDLILRHADSCLAFAHEYDLDEFQRGIEAIVLSRISTITIRQCLWVAQKQDNQTLMRCGLAFVQDNAAALLTDPHFLHLATVDPELWHKVIDAVLDCEMPPRKRTKREPVPFDYIEVKQGRVTLD